MYDSSVDTLLLREPEHIRLQLEPLLWRFGVDLAVWAHVHMYERTHPTYQQRRVANGTTHLVLGSGGKSSGLRLWRLKPAWSAFRSKLYGLMRFVATRNATGCLLVGSYIADDANKTTLDSFSLARPGGSC